MHILDTDTLTHLHAGHPQVIRNLRHLDDPDIGTTIITKIEILRGRFDFLLKASSGLQLLKTQQRLHASEELLAQIFTLPFDERVITHFDRLKNLKGVKKIYSSPASPSRIKQL